MPQIWKPRINPALHRHPQESAVIGRLVVAFGELEYITISCADRAANAKARVLRALYRLRATSARIEVADALMRPTFVGSELERDYANMIEAVKYCLKIRNQYAHCNWADEPNGGPLFFADLEETAQADDGWDHYFRSIDLPLLQAQEEYFVFTQSFLYFFESELSKLQERPIYPSQAKPIAVDQPPLHNPSEAIVPAWLSEDQKAQHLARAQASQGGPPTPTRAQKELDQARAAKKAQRAENIRKAREGEERAKQNRAPDE